MSAPNIGSCTTLVGKTEKKDSLYYAVTVPFLEKYSGESVENFKARAGKRLQDYYAGIDPSEVLCVNAAGNISALTTRPRPFRSDWKYEVITRVNALGQVDIERARLNLNYADAKKTLATPVRFSQGFFNYPWYIRGSAEFAGANGVFGVLVSVLAEMWGKGEARWTLAGRTAFEIQKLRQMEEIKNKLNMCGNLPEASKMPPDDYRVSQFAKKLFLSVALPAVMAYIGKSVVDAQRMQAQEEVVNNNEQNIMPTLYSVPDYSQYTDEQLEKLVADLDAELGKRTKEKNDFQYQEVFPVQTRVIARLGLPDTNAQEWSWWHSITDGLPIAAAFGISVPKLANAIHGFSRHSNDRFVWQAAKEAMKKLIGDNKLSPCDPSAPRDLIAEIDQLPMPVAAPQALPVPPDVQMTSVNPRFDTPTLLQIGIGASAGVFLGTAAYLSAPYWAPYLATLSLSSAATVGLPIVLVGLVAFAGYHLYQNTTLSARETAPLYGVLPPV